MSEWKWVWWNLKHGPTEKDDEIRELRRALEAVTERELELRRGEWVMRYFDAVDEIKGLESDRDRWRSLANALTRDLAFRTDEQAANFIVQQMVARIERERAVRGE